ncbi:hypothetical protein IK146_03705 [Candidatus Saccharibacteria bacterium]|nr:hypothetical protein [Candidatus Saccharibacteria bacterium]
MGSVSFARTLLVVGAYVFDGVLGLGILAVFIYLLGRAFDLPDTWMPEYYNPANRLSNTSKRDYRKEVWCSMSDEERAKARKDRVVNIAVYIVFIAVFIAGSYIVIRYIWPMLIDLAKTM